jgi:hypothetical protein
MASVAARGLRIGTIIETTLGVLERNALPVLAYLAVVTALNGAVTWYSLGVATPAAQLTLTLVSSLLGIVAAYFLLQALLRRAGLGGRREAFYPFLGLSLVHTLGFLFGLLLLVLPGLLILARWSIAQPLILVRPGPVLKTLGESWEETRGNEFSILVAGLALMLPMFVVMIASMALFEGTDPIRLWATQLAGAAISATTCGLSVALYGLIVRRAAAADPAA